MTAPAETLVESVGRYVTNLATPTVRLGVTGFSRAGKTVLVTSLVRNLIEGGRLPFFGAVAEGRLIEAHLEPQPNDALPRFRYEDHLAALASSPPEWPEGTRRISQLRLVLTYRPTNPVRRWLGVTTLNVDLIDYPGEWLIDLGMLGQSYAEWAADAIDVARDQRHRQAAKHWLDFQRGLDPYVDEDEAVARQGAEIFRDYLIAARKIPNALATLGPGRFLMPGDLEDSPLLTFFPLDLRGLPASPRGSLAAMMARRYESYRQHVVRPFFRNHFSRIDRQIVLIDLLNALNAGPGAMTDLQIALEDVLKAFRPGANSWLASVLGRHTDRVLFAATKADHLPQSSYDRLEAILRLMTDQAVARAEGAGARVRTMALSAVRATRERKAKSGSETLPCIVGVPLPGQSLDGQTFDGETEAALFPGDLPQDPKAAFSLSDQWSKDHQAIFLRFRPPTVLATANTDQRPALPHVRLDRALEFLLGDYLS
jgi:uncharacterized protein